MDDVEPEMRFFQNIIVDVMNVEPVNMTPATWMVVAAGFAVHQPNPGYRFTTPVTGTA